MLESKLKGMLRSHARLAEVYAKAKERYLRRKFGSDYMTSVFGHIWERGLWDNPESLSGAGSTLDNSLTVRRKLPDLLRKLEVRSILDAACGDFNWMQHVELGEIRYTGADVVPGLIASNQLKYGREGREFLVLDVSSNELPSIDLILCRHCWIHWSFSAIKNCVANFKRSGARYLVATTSPQVEKNRDILTGQWRPLNLERPPLDFPQPLWRLQEDMGNADLALWSVDQLPH